MHDLKKVLTSEFNIEGNPTEEKFVHLVVDTKPHQVTLVPDAQGQLTSDHGWDTVTHQDYLIKTIALFKNAGIRVSIFVDPIISMVEAASTTGTDRIELYTESYASAFTKGLHETALEPYKKAALVAHQLGLGINAGHDLDLQNLSYFKNTVPLLN